MPGQRLTITVLASIAAATIGVAALPASLLPAAAAAHRQQHPASVNTALSSSAPSGTSHGCDPIGTAGCLIPFPDDYYAVRDADSLTGERVAFTPAMMPASAAGVHLDPASWDRSDGFSPGGPILTVLPGADLTASRAAPITDIGASLNQDAPELQPGRSADVVPFWGIPPIPRFPYHGSALFMWDSGSPQVPLSNIPPTAGHDPHDDLATTPAPQELGADLLLTGTVQDICGGTPCYALP